MVKIIFGKLSQLNVEAAFLFSIAPFSPATLSKC